MSRPTTSPGDFEREKDFAAGFAAPEPEDRLGRLSEGRLSEGSPKRRPLEPLSVVATGSSAATSTAATGSPLAGAGASALAPRLGRRGLGSVILGLGIRGGMS